MFERKKGYTLSEVLVVLALLGVLAAILLPAIARVRPDRNKMMFKKAYYTAERIVYELVNDDALYPSVSGKKGLDYLSSVTFGGNTYSGNTKFCGLFVRKVNTVNDYNSCPEDGKFKTTDGVEWTLPTTDFEADATISVTIGTGENAATYSMYVKPDGKMYVNGTTEKSFLGAVNALKD